jgi:zona occludens toxin (predicted ATPase)
MSQTLRFNTELFSNPKITKMTISCSEGNTKNVVQTMANGAFHESITVRAYFALFSMQLNAVFYSLIAKELTYYL